MKETKKITPPVTEVRDERIWRRFEVINQKTLAEAEMLVERKQLKRHELALLLETFRLRDI